MSQYQFPSQQPSSVGTGSKLNPSEKQHPLWQKPSQRQCSQCSHVSIPIFPPPACTAPTYCLSYQPPSGFCSHLLFTSCCNHSYFTRARDHLSCGRVFSDFCQIATNRTRLCKVRRVRRIERNVHCWFTTQCWTFNLKGVGGNAKHMQCQVTFLSQSCLVD